VVSGGNPPSINQMPGYCAKVLPVQSKLKGAAVLLGFEKDISHQGHQCRIPNPRIFHVSTVVSIASSVPAGDYTHVLLMRK
jgi:hypothetical protein